MYLGSVEKMRGLEPAIMKPMLVDELIQSSTGNAAQGLSNVMFSIDMHVLQNNIRLYYFILRYIMLMLYVK